MKKEGIHLSLSEQIMSDMKEAMKARDKVRLNTVRMIKSALMNEKIKAGHDLTAEEELTVLSREKKQREESIAEFTKADRKDLAEETKQELAIVESYLPKQMTPEELDQAVSSAIAEVNAQGKSDFGKVMKVLMPKIKGKADGKEASAVVRKQLN